MARRFYLSQIIGDGSDDNPYRPAVARPNVNYSAVYPPQDPETGAYTRPFCLVVVEAVNHATLIADGRNDVLPDFPPDGKVSALAQARRTALQAALTARGLTAHVGNIDGYDGYRHVLNRIGQYLQAGFDLDAIDVSG